MNKLLLMTVFAALLIWNCEENPVKLPLVSGSIVVDTLYATVDRTDSIQKVLTSLDSPRLLLGSLSGYDFRIIMQFFNLPDTITIDSAYIKFVSLQASGGGNLEGTLAFTTSGYRIINSWIADTSAVWKDFRSNIDFSAPLGSMAVTAEDSGEVRFEFNEFGVETVNNWLDSLSGVPNNGLMLDFEDAAFIKELRGRSFLSTLPGPFLFYTYDTGDSTITDSIQVSSDAFLSQGDFQPVAGRLHTATITPWVTLLKFNLDTLVQLYPNGIIVESASLQLPVDKTNSLIHRGSDPAMQILPLTSPIDSPKISIDTTTIGVESRVIDLTLFSEDSSFVEVPATVERQQLAQNYVQRYINSTAEKPFQGFYVEFKTHIQYLANFAFFRHDHIDRRFRPRLIVVSLRLPDERF